ncbi:Gfo/Idh/MocA family oxidoreductase [Aureimonas fodinaquatilis]|uniref:Gfo/Idh/MocA family oxidoreductase n=1 Tax=Aureimonas fodinaquatilis TaxID=2565783 RepID=A0A5B0DVW7_9HYPH|nr:Gfo/Idh/MocA family oxidoreductase [Aureimonas fodinaquatilis]KAA0970162.1 Gfo/Idh/MocA family oxidoreductase [Aureimonas fodinaquatilis]
MTVVKMNVALIGCGWVAGLQMINGFNHVSDLFNVQTACDNDLAKAQAFAREYGLPEAVASYEAVLADPQIDAVSICTPPSLHHSMVKAALAAGKNVICEKPFTSSLELVDDIMAMEALSSARVMPVFQYRFAPGLQRIRRILASGIAGKAYTSSVETAWRRGSDYYAVPWRGKFATELGGVLLTQSIHIHDLFLYLRGPVAEVKAFKATRVNPIEVEDCAVAALRMEDGSLASLTATLGSIRPVTRIRLCFENMVIERQCFDEEAPRPGNEPWTIVPVSDEVARKVADISAEPAEQYTSFAFQFAQFHRAINTGEPFAVTLEDARRSLELVTALFHSAETDETVSLPMDQHHERYGGWISHSSRAAGSAAAVPALQE